VDYLLEMGDRAAFVEVISSDGIGLKKGRDGEEPHPSPMGAGGDPGEPVVDGIIIDKQSGDTLFKM